MKKLFAAAAVAALLFPAASFAETLAFPSDKPVASITIPDSWNPEETDTGIQATSSDEAIYLAIDVADAADAGKLVDEAIKFLDKNGVKVDESTQKQSEDTINGMKMMNFDWSGKDKDGPAYQKVAEKYKGKDNAEARLIEHITSGEKAKFPDGHEEAHKIVKTSPPNDAAQIKNLVDWILSL